jgi:hypothetical protein
MDALDIAFRQDHMSELVEMIREASLKDQDAVSS